MTVTARLYLADTESLPEALFAAGRDRLPEMRRAKLDRLRLMKDKKLSLAVWLLLEAALQEEGLALSRETLAFTAEGKPFLPEHPSLCFNLSHSGTQALVGLASRSIGVDTEQCAAGNHRLAPRFFAPEEAAFVASQADEREMDLAFTRIWTLKESFIKATGTGFSLPLPSFSVLPGQCGPKLKQSCDRRHYCLFEYPEAFPAGDYAVSCCLLRGRQLPEKPPLIRKDLAELA